MRLRTFYSKRPLVLFTSPLRLLLGGPLLLSKVLLVAGIEDIVLLVSQEAILSLTVKRLIKERVKVEVLVYLLRLFGTGRRFHTHARLGRLLLELREDHLAALSAALDNLLGFLYGLRIGWLLDPDIAPESVAEFVSARGGETPVRNEGAGFAGSSQQHREPSLLARGDLGVASSALSGRHELVNAGWVLGVDSAHVVAASKLDSAACRPRLGTTITEVPGLLKDSVGCEDRAIHDGITDEVGNQAFLASSGWELLGLHSHWDLLLGLGWLDLSHGPDLGSRVHRGSRRGLSGLGDGAVLTVTHHWQGPTIVMVAHSGDRHIADRSLELDKRVSLVVWVGRIGLAAGTEVGIVTDSTLISDPGDEGLDAPGGIAERSITVDAGVASIINVSDLGIRGFVDLDKLVAGVDEAGVDSTERAVVPVWAINALVANAVDILVTTIADGIVTLVAAGCEEGLSNEVEFCAHGSRGEGVLWIMAMPEGDVARNAEIVVFTGSAGNELVFGPLYRGVLVLSHR